MTISGFSNSFVSAMLSWLKGVANLVLRLFNLAGSTGTSPLLWLSQNWAKLLVLFLIIGGRIDHQRFTEDDDIVEDDWSERDFVVASSVAKKPERRPRAERVEEEKPRRGRSEETRVPSRGKGRDKRRTTVGTIVKRGRDTEQTQGDSLFEMEGIPSNVADSYEDEVFNVNSLPQPARRDGEAESLFDFDEEE